MRKVVAVFLAFMLVAVLAACNDDEQNTTTETLVLTTASQDQQQVSASPTDGNGNPTMILTTQIGQTMPTVVTTAFDLKAEAASAATSVMTEPTFDFTVPDNMTAPPVNVSQIETSATTTSANKEDEDDNATEDKEGPKTLNIENVATTGDNQLVIAFSPDGWGSSVKSKPATIKVTDSNGEEWNVTARLSGKDADGNHKIVIDTADLTPGTTITFKIPAQFVESKSGKVYNSEYPVSAYLDWEEEAVEE